MELSESHVDEIERLNNASIHELVFAYQNAAQGDGDDALTCLVQVQQNCERVADMIVAQQKKEGET